MGYNVDVRFMYCGCKVEDTFAGKPCSIHPTEGPITVYSPVYLRQLTIDPELYVEPRVPMTWKQAYLFMLARYSKH